MRIETTAASTIAISLMMGVGHAAAQDSSVNAGLGLTPEAPVRTPQPPQRTVVLPHAQTTPGASWAANRKTDRPAVVEGYPYYSMEGLFASVCNAPYQDAKRDCPNMSSVQALGAMQLLMYYGNLIGNESVLVVIPKSKLGQLAGSNEDVKLNQMTRAFRAKNTRTASAAQSN